MNHKRMCSIALLALALTISRGVFAQNPPAVDPAAISALQQMGAYLRSLGAFQVEAVTTDEDVLDNGQKIQYAGVTNIVAKLPSRLRAEVNNDRFERMYFYDGAKFTLFAQRPNYYATVPAPAKIVDLADNLQSSYGFSVPLEDLFRWGSPGWNPANITAAMKAGPSVVLGTTCEQYAFRQSDVDWQIWIQRGDFPLPRKIVITDRMDEARPQHVAVYTWNLAPSFNDAAFVFQPPPDAQRVVMPKSTPAAAKPVK